MVSRYRAELHAFRIADARYPIFNGGGAMQFGARWNSPGRPVSYAALTYAGAMLEVLARIGRTRIPANQRCVEIASMGAIGIEEVVAGDLPEWNASDLGASRAYGDLWLAEGRTVALVIPSVVAALHERNVAINPAHAEFGLLRAGPPLPVVWDERLFDRR